MTIDDRIRDALGAQPVGDRPTPEARAEVEASATRLRRRRTQARAVVGSLAVVAALVAVVIAWPAADLEVRTASEAGPAAVVDEDEIPADWVTVIDPSTGLTLRMPPSWTSRSFEDLCRVGGSGTVVRNNGEPPMPPMPPSPAIGCTSEIDQGDLPDDAVVVSVVDRTGGPAALIPQDVEVSTFPLTLPPEADLEVPASTPPGTSLPDRRYRYTTVWAAEGQSRFLVAVVSGVRATDEDRAAARLVVASMRPPVPSPSPTEEPVEPLVTAPGERTVELPTIPVQELNPAALVTGTLVRDGECLFLDTGRERSMVLWQGEATMTLAGEQLVGVTVRGQALPVDVAVQVGGGGVPAVVLEDESLGVRDVRPECVTPTIIWAS